MAGCRRARAGFPLVALLVGALCVLVPALPAFAATSLTVTPHTGLSDGTVVTLVSTGWAPGTQLGYCEAVPVAPASVDDCHGGFAFLANADSSGTLNTTFVIHRLIEPPVEGGLVDCAAPSTPCVLAVADAAHVDTAISVTLGFAPPPPPSIVPGNGSGLEGNSGTSTIAFPVSVHDPDLQTVTADWRTVFVPGAAGNQADPATDYTPASGTVTFAPGATGQLLTISINGDHLVEPDEFIVVQFFNPTNATIGGSYGLATVTIKNDDTTRLLPGSASVLEGDSGTTNLIVPVTLSNPSTQTITAQWRTAYAPGAAGNQADPASDYTPGSGTVTFAPGQTAQTVTISINGDTTVEPDEFLIVQFGRVVNAQLGGFYGLGVCTITNDD